MNLRQVYILILAQAILATLWSLYYWWFWDPIINVQTGNFFLRSNWFTPCEMCRFAATDVIYGWFITIPFLCL